MTDSFYACIAVMAIGFGCNGATFSGHMQSPFDVAPRYSGTALGFSNGLGSVTGFITPLVANAFTKVNQTEIHSARIVIYWFDN